MRVSLLVLYCYAQITIHLPQDFKIKVSEGEYCLAGQTAISLINISTRHWQG